MTGQELLNILRHLDKDALNLRLYGIHGASGVSYEISGGSLSASRTDDIGPVGFLPNGTPYFGFYLE